MSEFHHETPHFLQHGRPPFGAPACLASLDPSTNQSANSQARSPGFHREKERVLIVIPVIYQVLDGFFLALSPGFINKSWWYQLFYGNLMGNFCHRSDWRGMNPAGFTSSRSGKPPLLMGKSAISGHFQ